MTYTKDGLPAKKCGRKQRYSDVDLMNLIVGDENTDRIERSDELMKVLDITSKSHLFKRLRELEEQGMIEIERHSRKEGYTIRIADDG
jgi:uncharacterized membrane protein